MVMELVAMGSLDKVLVQFGDLLRTRVRLSMCQQVCSAVCELARERVLHRDLAARNVLVQSIYPKVLVKVRRGRGQGSPNEHAAFCLLPTACLMP